MTPQQTQHLDCGLCRDNVNIVSFTDILENRVEFRNAVCQRFIGEFMLPLIDIDK